MGNWIPDDETLKKMLMSEEEIKASEVKGNIPDIPEDFVDSMVDEREKIEVKPAVFEELQEENESGFLGTSLELLFDVELPLSARLGSVVMSLEEVTSLGVGSVISLERLAGESIDVLIGDEVVAKADVVVTVDKYSVVIKEIMGAREKIHTTNRLIRKQMMTGA
ncbi:FliM/FliN family flagellar motor switch protein [Bacillus bombysepticus]|uniref:FliM/FliN family flagellar motor switch protein n=1 Tax=Bacillus bombysepticus TaxID=658666 RepID=UPI0030166513